MMSVMRITQGVQSRLHRHLLDPLQDGRLGIEASGRHWPKELSLVGRNAEHSNEYVGTPSLVLHRALDALKIDTSRFVFIDLGSGKGRVLLRAAMRPFRRVEGVELSEPMHRIAQKNLRLAEAAGLVLSPVAVHHLDVTDYKLPQEPMVLYLFNPFGEAVIGQVLETLAASLREHPRECYVIYLNPVHRDRFKQCPLLEEMPRPTWAKALDRLISPWPLITYQYRP